MAKKFDSIGTGLLQDVVTKTDSLLNTQNIVEIPLEQIHENPDNSKIFPLDKIEMLAKTIERDGFVGAIEVIKTDTDQYEISAGHRRYLAMKSLNKRTIPAIIISNLSDVDKARRLISSNINSRELTPLIYSNMINYYKTNVLEPSNFEGNTLDELADFFGISRTMVKRYQRINKLIPELRELMKNPEFPWTRLDVVTAYEEELQREVYEQIRKYMEMYPGETNSAKIEQIARLVKEKHNRAEEKELMGQSQEITTDSPNPPMLNFHPLEYDSSETADMHMPDINTNHQNETIVRPDTSEKPFQRVPEKEMPNAYHESNLTETQNISNNEPVQTAIAEDRNANVKKTVQAELNTVSAEIYLDSSLSYLRQAVGAHINSPQTVGAQLLQFEELIQNLKHMMQK